MDANLIIFLNTFKNHAKSKVDLKLLEFASIIMDANLTSFLKSLKNHAKSKVYLKILAFNREFSQVEP